MVNVAILALAVCALGCSELRDRPVPDAGTTHAPGIMDPDSDEFHAQLLRDLAYDYDTCRTCHGDDFMGGISGVACTDCHQPDPTACRTCHQSDLLQIGGHDAHVNMFMGEIDFRDCVECHITPTVYDEVGHILLADGTVDPPPTEINFGDLAATDPDSPNADRTGPPSYDYATATCAQVYCHGDVFADTDAALTQPVWLLPGQTFCGSCHGLGPESHASNTCQHCHQQVIDDMGFVNEGLHVDGTTQLGRHGNRCNSCHGTEGGLRSPPLSLSGGSSPSLIAVGAHESHMTGANAITVPIDCTECHVVPSSLHDPGHIDDAYPAEVSFDPAGLASASSATPVWDRASGTCSTVYCHGGGTNLDPSRDTSPSVNRMPGWTEVNQGISDCDSCHGLAPSFSPHNAGHTVDQCTWCHSSTVDASGDIVFGGSPGSETSLHLNGMLDL